MTITAFVLRPCVASISERVPLMLCIIRFTGAASGLTTATILREFTTLPNPILINLATKTQLPPLLNILNLLTDLLDLCLESDRDIGNFKITGFRQDRIRLTVHLLRHEVHLASHAFLLIQDLLHSKDMAVQTDGLLIIADLVRKKDHLCRDTVIVDLAVLQKIMNLLLQLLTVRTDYFR